MAFTSENRKAYWAKKRAEKAPEAPPPTPVVNPEEELAKALSSPSALDDLPDTPMPQLSMKDFMRFLLVVVQEARKPVIDPMKERQKERARATLKQAQEDYWKQLKAKERSCSHLRSDGSCCIFWAEQSDGVVRGVCCHCDSVFAPGHERYSELRRMPTGPQNDVKYVYA